MSDSTTHPAPPHNPQEPVFEELCARVAALGTQLDASIDELRGMVEALAAERAPDGERLLRTEEACDRLAISKTKLEELVAARELRPVRIGRARRFTVRSIDAFIRDHVG